MFGKRAPLLVGTLLLLGLVTFVTLYRSSPGELSQVHTQAAGSPLITDCKKCHSEDGLSRGCLACHTEIAGQYDQQKGYHYFLRKQGKGDCATCHSEHNGPAFALVNKVSWQNHERAMFRHEHTTFTLTGAHLTQSCDKCHNGKRSSPFSLPQFPEIQRKQTFLHLRQACISCHADPHAGGLASQCAECHSQTRWKPAPHFDHEKFFPLRGAHAQTACSGCHETRRASHAQASVRAIFGPVKGKTCTSCHTSPHRTPWDRSCEACHQSRDLSWTDADRRMTPLLHAKTGFPLNPPHQKVTCVGCHSVASPDNPYRKRYPDPEGTGYTRRPRDCEGCHKDPHGGQFVSRYPKCFACHNVGGWKPTKFDIQAHNKTAYPLAGGHQLAACNKCHKKDSGSQIRRFANTPISCASCHRDIHYGQFRDAQNRTLCEKCHKGPQRWTAIRFNHETQSAFKLGDAHKTVACKSCHPLVTLSDGSKLIQYKPIKRQCSDCHSLDELQPNQAP